MTQRELKEHCYLETLEKSLISVEILINRVKKIEEKKGVFDDEVLLKDHMETFLGLELSLATLCVLLRKMSENLFIQIPKDIRQDMNSIIHSNRFEYDEKERLVVYSQKGREVIELENILNLSRSIISDKVLKEN